MADEWGCAVCTFANAAGAARCEMCGHAAASSAGTSSGATGGRPTPSAAKKPRASPPGNKVQRMLGGVGASREQEAQRLQRKVAQMKELGIDLPAAELLPLLARHCYSVSVAANAYFEQMARADEPPGAHDNTAVAGAVQLRSGFRLLGVTTMAATVTRSGVKLRAGEEVGLVAENVGKKRLRNGAAVSTAATGAGSAATTVTVNGFVRVLNASKSQVGRLERELEAILHPLMKEQLVALDGVCRTAPFSSQMFSSFEVTMHVQVNEKAFSIFDEEHPQFYLADAMYSLLEMFKPRGGSSSTGSPSKTAAAFDSDSKETINAGDLDTLFSECVGANDMLTGESTSDGVTKADPSEQLAPHLLDIELRDHQKQALRWMSWREQLAVADAAASKEDVMDPMWEERQFYGGEDSGCYYVNPFEKIASLTRPKPPAPCPGGILADDMGMGKTMMMLSLVAHDKLFNGSPEVEEEPRQRSPFAFRSQSNRSSAKTLIVCPLSLLHQWKNEVEERFRPQTLGVYVYYGDDRDNASTGISSADVVLTTYGVLSTQHERQGTDGVLVRTSWHRIILDEAHSIKNRGTNYFRACAALQARHRWCLTGTPIQNSLDDMFSLLSFLQYEPWSRVSWWKRVIGRPFDSGDAASALARLKAILTPVLLRRTKHSRDKSGELIVRLPNKHVELVTLEFSPDERAFYRAVYDRSRAEFNGYVASGSAMSSYVAIFALLLRLRQACNHPLLALGRNVEQVNEDSMSNGTSNTDAASFQFRPRPNESSDAYYRRISAQLQQDLKATSSALTEKSIASSDTEDSNSSGLTRAYIDRVMAQVEDGLETQECPICLDPPREGVLTPCAHILCASCLRDSLAGDPDMGCPVCRVPVDMNKVFVLPSASGTKGTQVEGAVEAVAAEIESVAVVEEPADTHSNMHDGESDIFMSTKLRQLVKDLEQIRTEDAAGGPRRKVVVFSQWTLMLEMVEKVLSRRGFGCSVFHGGMAQEARERVLTRFARDSSVDVLVISLKAGGVGLNLTCASVVVLLDPWWNPGVEEQAVDRVHRLGQAREVLVKRYVVSDTVEGMMRALQERKQALASRALVVSKAHDEPGGRRQNALNLDDLKRFFS